jgi:16S rRNA (cytosine1402-N4)-methyltransferase
MPHIPVLLNETIQYLNAKKGGIFIDGTVGGGGHLKAILAENFQNQVIGVDLDQASLYKLKGELTLSGLDQRSKLVQGSYANIDKILHELGVGSVDGVLLDLGFSSLQLDEPDRGFSFAEDGPLDMRFDREAEKTAESIVNRYQPKDLEKVIFEFGEEKFAKRIVSNIIEARKISPIATTKQLAEIVRKSIPLPIRFKASDSIRRVFQAIRIEVNQELNNLKIVLPKILKVLNPEGRIVIISFHSLEDRIVKEFFVTESKGCVCPVEFPTCVCDKASSLKILTRKPIAASEEEINNNPRSKPAKLRAAEKLK